MAYLIEADSTVSDLMAKIGGSQSTVSRHLKKMRKPGLIDCRKEGTWRVYFCNSVEARMILRVILGLVDEGRISHIPRIS
ncbi:ArsR/SmtB family transcription factor [Mesorhizobium sp. INR15]|uniref:ArsR/SmtB family transcription factor n=1 Tax=Mesorhizobium sp. INR15 TaxID=2654248 RepID=UPI0035BBBE13